MALVADRAAERADRRARVLAAVAREAPASGGATVRVCIVGCGAVGSLFAGEPRATSTTSRCGPTTLRRRTSTRSTRTGSGSTGAGEVIGRLQRDDATPAELPPCDSRDRRDEGDAHRRRRSPRRRTRSPTARSRSVQNGVGNEEVARAARRARDPRHDVPGGEDPRARRRAVGREGRHDARPVRAAARARGRDRARSRDACTRGGMPTAAVADARPAQWRKVIFNAVDEPGRRAHRPHARPRLRAARPPRARQRRSSTRARPSPAAQGIALDADPEELIDHAARPEVAYGHKASMLQDVEARRRRRSTS